MAVAAALTVTFVVAVPIAVDHDDHKHQSFHQIHLCRSKSGHFLTTVQTAWFAHIDTYAEMCCHATRDCPASWQLQADPWHKLATLASCHGYHRKCRNRCNSCSSYHSRLNKRHERQTIWICRDFWHVMFMMSPDVSILKHRQMHFRQLPILFSCNCRAKLKVDATCTSGSLNPPPSRVVAPAALAKLLMISRLGFRY